MDEMGESHLREFSFDSNNKEINWLILVSLLENAPFLNRLRLPVLYDEEPFHKVAQISQHGDNNITDANGLQSLEVRVCPGMGTVFSEYLPASLTKLQPDSSYLFTQIFVNTMVRLSNLISLEAKVRLTLSEGTEITEILPQDWACLRLKKLSLRILLVSSDIQLVEYVFGQIGRLQDLEELKLDGDQHHLKLKDGCLGYLGI
ncbi:hypothetical protein BGZ46_005260 [Entomortierella lignicola]|nr:hypothetical protein BGZ46_005260 [Entomortierella lignicola]